MVSCDVGTKLMLGEMLGVRGEGCEIVTLFGVSDTEELVSVRLDVRMRLVLERGISWVTTVVGRGE